VKVARVGVLAMAGLVLAGCVHRRAGVLAELPDPLFAAPVAQASPSAVSRPNADRSSGLSRAARAPAGWHPPGGVRDRWDCIVIHHSASQTGGARAFHEYHTKVRHWDELGYHFVIGNGTDTPDGCVEVGSRWTGQKHGAHCKVPGNYYNEHGIGICLVGNFERTQPTPAQMASLEKLTRFLMEACDISPGRIHTHGGVTGRTACPGRHFPVARFHRRLASTTAGGGYR